MHTPPHWVPDDSTFFITVGCRLRGVEQLTSGEIPARLFSAASVYHQQRKWFPEMILLMPDHLHALVSFNWDIGRGIKKVLANWKRYTATETGIDWQRDFFDHRIRSEKSHAEKWVYIRENPVRAGLVSRYDKWPHVWFPDRIGWQRSP